MNRSDDMTAANPYAYDPSEYKRTRRITVTTAVRTPIPAEQRPLEFEPAQPATAELTIEARFRRFDADNPHVYAALYRLAWEDVYTGARRISIKALYERLRGHVSTTGEPAYILNNDYTALYARKLAEDGLDGYIELRERKAK